MNAVPTSSYNEPNLIYYIRGKYYNKLSSNDYDLPYGLPSEVKVIQSFPFWRIGGMPNWELQAGYLPVKYWRGEYVEKAFPLGIWFYRFGFIDRGGQVAVIIYEELYDVSVFDRRAFYGNSTNSAAAAWLFEIEGGARGCNFVGVCHEPYNLDFEGSFFAIELSLVGATLKVGSQFINSSTNDGNFNLEKYTDRSLVATEVSRAGRRGDEPAVREYYRFSEAMYPTIRIYNQGLTTDEPVTFVGLANLDQYKIQGNAVAFFDRNIDTDAAAYGRKEGNRFFYQVKFSCPREPDGDMVNSSSSWPADSLLFKEWPVYTEYRDSFNQEKFRKSTGNYTSLSSGNTIVSSGKKIRMTIVIPSGKGFSGLVLSAWDTRAIPGDLGMQDHHKCHAVCVARGGTDGGKIKYSVNSSSYDERAVFSAQNDLAPGVYQFLFGALGGLDGHSHCAGDTLEIEVIKTKANAVRVVVLGFSCFGSSGMTVRVFPSRLLGIPEFRSSSGLSSYLFLTLNLSGQTLPNRTATFEGKSRHHVDGHAILIHGAWGRFHLSIVMAAHGFAVGNFTAELELFSRKMFGRSGFQSIPGAFGFAAKVVLSASLDCMTGFAIGKVDPRPGTARALSQRELTVYLQIGTHYRASAWGEQVVSAETMGGAFGLGGRIKWVASRPWFQVDSSERPFFAPLGGVDDFDINSPSGIYIDRESGQVVGTPKVLGDFWSKYETSEGEVYTFFYKIESADFIADFALRIEKLIYPHFALTSVNSCNLFFDKNIYVNIQQNCVSGGNIVLIYILYPNFQGSSSFKGNIVFNIFFHVQFSSSSSIFTGLNSTVLMAFFDSMIRVEGQLGLAEIVDLGGSMKCDLTASIAFEIYYGGIKIYSNSGGKSDFGIGRAAVLTVETEGYE